MSQGEVTRTTNFIRNIIDSDLESGKHSGVVTRFPPEPNGYLHVGHVKAICINFGIAEDYKGKAFLRFDDTNPVKEDVEFINSIQEDLRWMGFDWEDRLRHSSGYFQQLYEYAVQLIEKGKAYVCDLSAEETRQYRGSLKEAGKDSPFRDRSVEENLDLFERMKSGEFEDGTKVLRAKIDMGSPNMNLRDPTIYRIRRMTHHQTGDEWLIYPMYDFTHCLSDSIEGITHSLCSLEFEDHRPLYDWFLEQLDVSCHPQQIEFSRLSLEYTLMSKRKLTDLVTDGHVNGWDDPRMPTVAGLRRRGFTPESLRAFVDRVGVSKVNSTTEMFVLEDSIRQDLDTHAPRAMGVLDPLKVVIENYPEDQEEEMVAKCHPNDESMGVRKMPFTREVYIDRADFEEIPPPKYKRLTTGKEVRLRNSYVIRCDEVIKDEATGKILELRCSYDPETLGKKPEGRKVKGVIHWVSAKHAIKAEVRLYDRLFSVPNPSDEKDGKTYIDYLNPDSLKVIKEAYVEPSLKNAEAGARFQFEREGYFCVDAVDSSADKLVFNRVVTLRDSWAKVEQKKP